MKTYKILIVEDEKPLRDILVDKFKKEDFEVLEAADGEKGLKLALAENPDLILLDIVMPLMDGLRMAKKLREANNQIPIIFLTNLSEEKYRTNGQKEGIYDYLVKSNWTIEAVVQKVKDRLGI